MSEPVSADVELSARDETPSRISRQARADLERRLKSEGVVTVNHCVCMRCLVDADKGFPRLYVSTDYVSPACLHMAFHLAVPRRHSKGARCHCLCGAAAKVKSRASHVLSAAFGSTYTSTCFSMNAVWYCCDACLRCQRRQHEQVRPGGARTDLI